MGMRLNGMTPHRALRLSSAVVADSFFESGTTASEALCTTKAQLKRELRLTTISSAASVAGQLANFVIAVEASIMWSI